MVTYTAVSAQVVRLLHRDLGVKARAVSIDASCTQVDQLSTLLGLLLMVVQVTNRNPRLTKHTGADLVYIPPSWEQTTKSKISASRGTRDWYGPID